MSSTVAVITTLIRSRWDNPTYLQRPNSLSLTVTLFKHLLYNLALLSFQPRFNHEYFPLSWSTLPKYYLEYTSAIISNGYTSVYKATFSALLHYLNWRCWEFQIAIHCHRLQLGISIWIDSWSECPLDFRGHDRWVWGLKHSYILWKMIETQVLLIGLRVQMKPDDIACVW